MPDRAPPEAPLWRPLSPTASGSWLLAGTLLVAALLRLHDLSAGDVWVDEANSILTARYPAGSLLERLRTDSSPPLFYLLLRGWAALVGESPGALRAFSLLSGLGLVAALATLGRRFVSPRAALLAAWVAAVSPQQIYHGQQVRMYALLALLFMVSIYFLDRTLEKGDRRSAAAWGLATVAALYTHNFAFHLLPLQALWILGSGRLVTHWKLWCAVALAGLLAYLPWLPRLLEQVANKDHYAWYAPLWEARGATGTIYQTLLAYSPLGELVVKRAPDALPVWMGLPALALAAVAVLGAVRLYRHPQGGPASRFALAGAFALPVLTATTLSLLLTPHYVPGRVDQLMFPAFALLVGAGLAVLPGRVLPAVAALVLLLGCLAAKPLMYPDFRDYNFEGSDRALSLAISERWREGDALLCTSLTRASVEYYLSLEGIDGPLHSFPLDTAAHLGSQNDARWLADPDALAEEVSRSLAAGLATVGAEGRLQVARVLGEMNLGLAPTRLRARGLRLVDRVGPFQQTDTGQRIVLEVYAPPRP